jgi:hypothetical protein
VASNADSPQGRRETAVTREQERITHPREAGCELVVTREPPPGAVFDWCRRGRHGFDQLSGMQVRMSGAGAILAALENFASAWARNLPSGQHLAGRPNARYGPEARLGVVPYLR